MAGGTTTTRSRPAWRTVCEASSSVASIETASRIASSAVARRALA